jgi:DNA-binding NarL/FixJ family response regulator
MSNKIKVAILEDHQIVADGYSFRLQDPSMFEIVGVASVYSEWEPLLAARPVDVALMDVKVPTTQDNPNPYPILRVMPQLVQAYPEMAFLVISAHAEPTLIQGVMKAGANGYILKDDNALLRELKNVLVSVVAGRGIYLSPQAKELLLQRETANVEPGVTPRQLEALSLCAAYPTDSTKDLALRMNVTFSTLRNLLSQSYLRLGVSGRSAAVLKAQQLGLLAPAEEPPVR